MLHTDEALDLFLQAFASGTFPRARWNHAAHVTVAGCYLQMYPQPEATRRIRAGIRHYNECQGIANTPDSGYHETLTLFWIATAAHLLAQCSPELSRAEKVRQLVEALAPRRDLFREYYSFDVVGSRQARREWVAPDLKPLPCSIGPSTTLESSPDTRPPSPTPVSNPA
jgi:hypothetical protein